MTEIIGPIKGITCSGRFSGGALGAKAPPLKCISPWPIAYVAKLRNKSNYYSLFGDTSTDLAQQTIPHSSASNILFLIYAYLFYLMHHNVWINYQ